MNITEPPLEAQRYGRSQTPESPRPLHMPEPASIPVLQNQMDPIFNDTTTYDIQPDASQTFPDSPEKPHALASAFQNQDTATFLARVGQQISAQAQNISAVEQNHASAQMMSSIQSTENQPVSQAVPDFPADDNAPSAQQPLLSEPQAPHQATYPPSNAMSNTGQDAPESAHSIVQPSQERPQEPFEVPSNDHQSHTAPSETELAGDPITESVTHGEKPADDGVNFQSLLDNLSQSAPNASVATFVARTEPSEAARTTQSVSDKPLPAGIGLPPRPPPQEKPAIHPNYSATENIQSYHQLPTPSASASYPNQGSPYGQDVGMPPVNIPPPSAVNARAANGLALPPPVDTLQQTPQHAMSHQSPSVQPSHSLESAGSPSIKSGVPGAEDDDRPWGPDVQEKYEEFLKEERVYVTEGVWDRFPAGSRLFVGNLPTEKVTKRDLFHIFHRHGKLAQISIKQAYGFVQFLEAAACHQALATEQGVAIRGRKIHLEISKPQKNTRNAGNGDRGSNRRRSRSPDRRVNSRSGHTGRLPFSDFRDEPNRRRDDYRPLRSPSPRGYRSREEYRARERSPGPYDRYDAMRMPPNLADFRPPSPRAFDDDAALPLPRRNPGDVPDIQILILEEVNADFVNYVEQGFRQKGLRAQTIWLNPRITLAAVIKRQIIEGVQAVVKLTRSAQYSSKIPLQVFDRGSGQSNVNFNEYVELDVHVAADIVISARQKERMTPAAPVPPPYAPNLTFSAPQQFPYPQQHTTPHPYQQQQQNAYPQHQPQLHQISQPQHQQYPPQPAPTYHTPQPSQPSTQPAAPNLQELLANLRQPSNNLLAPAPAQPSMQTPNGGAPDLAGLLSNVARQQSQAQNYSQAQAHQSPISQYPNRAPLQAYPNPSGTPTYGSSVAQQPQQNVQNIMEQLARWNK